MNILLAEENNFIGKNAGSKARRDVECILKKEDFRYVRLYKSNSNKIFVALDILLAYIKVMLLGKKIDNIVIEHPYIPFTVCKLLGKLAKKMRNKGVCTILLIHDINSIRYENQVSIEDEIKTINMYQYVIVHNKKMRDFLLSNGCKSSVKELAIFDYLLKDDEIGNNSNYDNRIVAIAGNLSVEKSGYLYKLGDINNIKFNLYGNGVDENLLPDNAKYCGSYTPEEIPGMLIGAYGLIWDGDEIYSCTGRMGNYLQFNNPHKASLYIVSGMPLIVWRKSAIADLIIEKNIGICIETIAELDKIIADISLEQYNEMVENIMNMRNDLIHGKYLLNVIESILDKENEY